MMVDVMANARRDARRAIRAWLSTGLCLGMVCGAVSGGSARRQAPEVPQGRPAALRIQERASLEPAVAEHLRSLEASAEALVRAGASDDRLALAYGLLAQAYHAYSLIESARATYEKAHRLAPADFRWPYLLACVLQQENRADEALSYYERARGIRADYAPLAVHVGNLHLGQNRLEEASQAFEAALALDASMAAAHYGLGQVAMSRRDYARAVERFSRVLTLVPDANRVHYALALAFRGLGEVEQAQAHLRRQGPVGVRVADPLVDGLSGLVQGARLTVLRGRMAFESGRYAEAAEAFRRAVTAEPDNLSARVNLGSALGQIGEADGAIEQFNKALELDPDNRSALYNLGVLYASRNRHDEAIRHLTRLLELTPDDLEARLTLGRELGRTGRLEDALTAFAAVAGANPDHEDAVLNQVDVLAMLGRHREAIDTLERSHARFPTKGRTAAQLAYLLAASPQPDLRDYGRALELARRVYDASGAIRDGAVIAAALAGLGRCEEAASWQREMIARAEQVEPAKVTALRADLERYLSSCR